MTAAGSSHNDAKMIATASLIRAIDGDQEQSLADALESAITANLKSKWVDRAEARLLSKRQARLAANDDVEKALSHLMSTREATMLHEALVRTAG